MFLQYYGLGEQPFGVTPNPRYLYHSSQHREALASLIYGIEADTGFAALVAPPGLGKTTLLFYLLENFRATARTALIFQTQCTSTEFLRYLAGEFELGSSSGDTVFLNEQIRDMLVGEARAGRRVIIIVDEAQNLSEDVLETVRLLSDFETPDKKLLHIILAGQPQLAEKLAKPNLSQLLQRVSMLNRLHPLPPDEVKNYIDYRLSVAGYRGPAIFTPQAVAAIASLSAGVPRKINRVCFNALSLACAIGKRVVDGEILREVSSDLDIGELLFDKGAIRVPDSLKDVMHPPLPPQSQPPASAQRHIQIPTAPKPTPTAPITWVGNTVAVANAAVVKSGARSIEQNSSSTARPRVVRPLPAPKPEKPEDFSPKRESREPEEEKKGGRLIALVLFAMLIAGAGGWALLQKGAFESREVPATAGQQTTPSDAAVELPESENLATDSVSVPKIETAVERGRNAARKPPRDGVRVTNRTIDRSGSQAAPEQVRNSVTAPVKVAGNNALVDFGSRSNSQPAPVAARPEDAPGTLLHRVPPVYPSRAIAAGIDGMVVLNAVITKDGRLKDIRPVQGNWLLAEAAIDAARKWVYRPYIVGGQPVEVETTIQMKFELPPR